MYYLGIEKAFAPLLFAFGIIRFSPDVEHLYSDGPIKVVLSPANTTYILEEGGSMSEVDCSCGLCNPSCNIHWFFSNNSLGNSSMLQLSDISRNISGEYSCQCVNPETFEEKANVVNIIIECKCILLLQCILCYKSIIHYQLSKTSKIRYV